MKLRLNVYFHGLALAGTVALNGCGTQENLVHSRNLQYFVADGDVFLALAADETAAAEQFVYASVTPGTESVRLCRSAAAPCGSDAIGTALFSDQHGRRQFRTNTRLKLADGLKMRVEALVAGSVVSHQIVSFQASGPDVPDRGQDYDWREDIALVDVPLTTFSGNTWNSRTFRDIMTHTRSPYLSGGPLTSVHETAHFLLHENDGRTPAGDKFIYAGEGKGAFLPEPALTTAVAETYIPRAVVARGKLYQTYIRSRPTQQVGENIFDEWHAYLVETHALVESTAAGSPIPNDSVEGASTEFLYYCAAVMLAVHEREPAHLQKTNFKAVFAMLAESARSAYEGLVANGLAHAQSQALLTHLQTDPAGQDIRDALTAIYGPVWTSRVLGF